MRPKTLLVARPVQPRTAPRRGRRISSELRVLAGAGLLLTMAIGGISQAQAAGAIHAVSTSGSDSAGGTETAPWRTIGHALSALAPGDTLIVHGGTYAEHVSVALHAGTASAPIVVRAASGERPIVK